MLRACSYLLLRQRRLVHPPNPAVIPHLPHLLRLLPVILAVTSINNPSEPSTNNTTVTLHPQLPESNTPNSIPDLSRNRILVIIQRLVVDSPNPRPLTNGPREHVRHQDVLHPLEVKLLVMHVLIRNSLCAQVDVVDEQLVERCVEVVAADCGAAERYGYYHREEDQVWKGGEGCQ